MLSKTSETLSSLLDCRKSLASSVTFAWSTSKWPAMTFFSLRSISARPRAALAYCNHIQNFHAGVRGRSIAVAAINGGAANIRNHANAKARPQMPLTISALTAPTDAAALLGERPFSGKMTNQVVNVGGSAPRQAAPVQ